MGTGVPQDYAEAGKWYRKAAEQGDADSQLNLGMMYQNGFGVQKDQREAAKWYESSLPAVGFFGTALLYGYLLSLSTRDVRQLKEPSAWIYICPAVALVMGFISDGYDIVLVFRKSYLLTGTFLLHDPSG